MQGRHQAPPKPPRPLPPPPSLLLLPPPIRPAEQQAAIEEALATRPGHVFALLRNYTPAIPGRSRLTTVLIHAIIAAAHAFTVYIAPTPNEATIARQAFAALISDNPSLVIVQQNAGTVAYTQVAHPQRLVRCCFVGALEATMRGYGHRVDLVVFDPLFAGPYVCSNGDLPLLVPQYLHAGATVWLSAEFEHIELHGLDKLVGAIDRYYFMDLPAVSHGADATL